MADRRVACVGATAAGREQPRVIVILLEPVPTMTRAAVRAALAVALIGASGCGPSYKVAEVKGKVTLDGTPLEMVRVEFLSANGPRSTGQTDESGQFTLTLDVPKAPKGAIVGAHKVVLLDLWPTKDDKLSESGAWIDNSNGKLPRIDSKYYDVSTSPLTADIKAGEVNQIEFKVDPRKKKR